MNASCKKRAIAATPRTQVGTGILQRAEFTTSRLAEFSSKEELTRLIGHRPGDWPVAALKYRCSAETLRICTRSRKR